MDDIKITIPEVSASATAIRNINNNLDEVLCGVSRLMNDLSSFWRGTAGETIVQRFQKFANKFIDENQAIEAYAKFLDYTVSSYDSLESTITSNASSFD